jgi:hypothetical protein
MGKKQRERAKNLGGNLRELPFLPVLALVVDGVDNDLHMSPYAQPDAIQLATRIADDKLTAEDERIIRSITSHGVLQPPQVQYRETEAGDVPVITDGRKRVLYARVVEKRAYDKGERTELGTYCVYCAENEGDASQIATDSNLRRTKEPSIIELGKYASDLVQTMTRENVAEDLNVSTITLGKYLKVYENGCARLHALIHADPKKWNKGNAYAVAKLDLELQDGAIDKILAGKNAEDVANAAQGKAPKIKLLPKKVRVAALQISLDLDLPHYVSEILAIAAQEITPEECESDEVKKLFELGQ